MNSYIGGNEHAVLHLMYSRFITMVLHDMGIPATSRSRSRDSARTATSFANGAKMSKTKGNIVNPDQYYEEWGADTFRTYLMFLGPYEEGGDFRDQSISGVRRFLDRLWASAAEATTEGSPDPEVLRKLHQTIQKVGDDVPRLAYNTAIAAMMTYINVVRQGERTPHRDEVEPLVQLVSPFAPHLAEELWEQFGHRESVFDAGWPAYRCGARARAADRPRRAGATARCAARFACGRTSRKEDALSCRAGGAGDRAVRYRRAEEGDLRAGPVAEHCRLTVRRSICHDLGWPPVSRSSRSS